MKDPSSPEQALFRLAASQILRALRAGRSQRALARRLGYRSNVCTDWEHGRRYPTAQEALRVAAQLGRELDACFGLFHPAPPPDPKDGYAVAPWLSALRGSTRNTELAQRMGVPFSCRTLAVR